MSRKNIFLIAAAVFAITVVLSFTVVRSRAANTQAEPVQNVQTQSSLVAGPGRVEPVSENIMIGSELSGKLKSVNFEEGDRIHRGDVLAVLINDDYRAQMASSLAQVKEKEATLRKVINGARTQERSEAFSSVREAEAVMNNAKSELDRRQKLFTAGVISKEELETYQREFDVAKAKYQEASDHHSLIDDQAREEDRSAAEAGLQLARAEAEEAQARYEKTIIRSPIDGIVLRKHHRNGESVSNSSTVPDPILTIGDTKVLRIRMDVDETDVNKVHVGQKAYVTADAYGQQKFWGHVVRIGEQLGPKNVHTDEPTERVDTKILETLIELDPGAELPIGLRVDAYIVNNTEEASLR